MPHLASTSRLFCRVALTVIAAVTARATDVLSYHNDQQSTGQNLAEVHLTPSSITTGAFGKLYATPVDGQVYAQPLYKAGVNITASGNAGTYDTVFVATEHDSLYAIDARTGMILWHTVLASNGIPGATNISSIPWHWINSDDLSPEIGVTGTPVIDPATNALYVDAKTMQSTADTGTLHFVHTLFKIDIRNGAILAHNIFADTAVNLNTFAATFRTNSDPTAAQDPFILGTGDGAMAIGGQSRIYFNAWRQAQRPGLLLLNGIVYIASASHGDMNPYHGWILGFNASDLSLNAAFNDTPNGSQGGFWQAGGIPAVDSDGYIYIESGNGTFDGYADENGVLHGLDTNTFPVNSDYGDCFLKLAVDPATTVTNQNPNGWGLKVVDYFSPKDTQSLDARDADLGSGGLVILPTSAGTVSTPRLLMGAGKEGTVYLINRDNMGKFDPNTDHVLQEQGNAIGGSFSTPAYFNGTIYWGGMGDRGKTFSIASAVFSPTPVSQTPDGFNFPGATPSISANGVNNGIAWMIDLSTSQLRAYDATDLSNELWTSASAGNQLGTAVKFIVPTVADGRVFVGTTNTLVCYSSPFWSSGPPAAPANLTAVAVSGADVLLSWKDHAKNADGYKIEQATDGINFTEVLTAGSMATSASVTGLDSSTIYQFRVRAFNAYQTQSFSAYTNVASTVTAPQPPSLNFLSGFGNAAQTLTFVSNNNNAIIAPNNATRITDGGQNEAGAVWSKAKQNIARFTCEFTFQITNTSGNSPANGFTFCIQNAGKTALGPLGRDLGYGGLKHSVALKFDFYNGSNGGSTTGLYVNGLRPLAGPRALDMTGAGINLQSGDTFSVSLVYDNGVLSETVTDLQTNAIYTNSYTINLPAVIGSSTAYVGFTGGTGSLTSTQDILTWSYAPIPAHPPTAPAHLVAAPASATQVNLTWKDTSSTEAAFIVERRIGTLGAFTQIGFTGPGTTTYMDTALTTGTTYYYRIRATNAAGQSAPTAAVKATPPAIPTAPTNARVASSQRNRVTLTWTDNASDEAMYMIFRTTANNFTQIAKLPPNSKSFTDTKVQPNTTYIYHVECSNVAGFSNYSETGTTTPQ